MADHESPRTSMDPELEDGTRAPVPMPKDPDTFELFGTDDETEEQTQ